MQNIVYKMYYKDVAPEDVTWYNADIKCDPNNNQSIKLRCVFCFELLFECYFSR